MFVDVASNFTSRRILSRDLSYWQRFFASVKKLDQGWALSSFEEFEAVYKQTEVLAPAEERSRTVPFRVNSDESDDDNDINDQDNDDGDEDNGRPSRGRKQRSTIQALFSPLTGAASLADNQSSSSLDIAAIGIMVPIPAMPTADSSMGSVDNQHQMVQHHVFDEDNDLNNVLLDQQLLYQHGMEL